jgi:ribosomal protein S18 acetylase RimI-like enzyme
VALRLNVLPTQVVRQRNHNVLVSGSRTIVSGVDDRAGLAHPIEAYLAAARTLGRYRRKAFGDQMIDEMPAAAEADVLRL